MGSIEVDQLECAQWGRCIKITNGLVELLITVNFGPRIIRFGLVGKENEFFEDVNNYCNENNEKFEVFGENDGWKIYGGHRLWISPEDMPGSYYPDNQPVDFEIVKNGVILTPPPQVYTNLQFQMKVIMKESGWIEITHKITNIGTSNKEFAPWALTVLNKNGLEYVPQPKKDMGLLSNRVLSLWSYTDMADERIHWGSDFITLRQNSNIDRKMKFGINNEAGYAAYFNHNNMFIKKYEHIENGNYPDGGVSFETFTAQHFLEMESIGQLRNVAPGEFSEHIENWCLIPNINEPKDEGEFESIISKYI